VGLRTDSNGLKDLDDIFIRSIVIGMTGVREVDIRIIDMNIHTHGLADNPIPDNRGMSPRDSLQSSANTMMSSGVRTLNSGNQRILHYVATSSVTFNASAALSRLSSTDGDIAYASLSRQLNTSMIDGSFLSKMKSSIPAFINVTTAYIHMLEHKVTSVPTSLPSVVPTISQIALIGIAATSMNITVTLTSDAGYISGGSLYCIAMVRGAVPSSAGALKTASSDASSSKGASVAFPKSTLLPLSLNLVIEDLAALQAYGIFCYAETTSGTGTALDVVIRDKVSASTACCRSVKYTNAPPYVYSDVTKYNKASRTTFIFSYELPNAPLSTLTVTPFITLDGAPSENVLATPASIEFTYRHWQDTLSCRLARALLVTVSLIYFSLELIPPNIPVRKSASDCSLLLHQYQLLYLYQLDSLTVGRQCL
jgi:hypothetical protein